MGAVELRPMTEAEYEAFVARSVSEYGEHKAQAGEFRPETATEQSQAEFDALLPAGRDTPGQLLFTALDPDGTAVGLLWLAMPQPDGHGAHRKMAWVYEVWVDPAARGNGYGRAIMLAAERELTARGVAELGLNVFGPNTTARRLYESLGYQVTAQQMAKSLGQ